MLGVPTVGLPLIVLSRGLRIRGGVGVEGLSVEAVGRPVVGDGSIGQHDDARAKAERQLRLMQAHQERAAVLTIEP